MRTIKGPALFLALFASNEAPFNNLEANADWASAFGFKGVQVPTWDTRLFDPDKVAESKTCCDEPLGRLADGDGADRAIDPPAGPARGGPSGPRHLLGRARRSPCPRP